MYIFDAKSNIIKFVDKDRKKTEHTRMYAQLCSSRAQYSRRLLSILAQPMHTNIKNKTRNVVMQSRYVLLVCDHCYFINVKSKLLDQLPVYKDENSDNSLKKQRKMIENHTINEKKRSS